MYKLYGKIDTRAFRVAWALEELGLDYDWIAAGPHSDAVNALSPWGKVPLLEVEGQILTDSTAIMQYLADRHGGLTYPAGSLERARQDGFTQLLNDEFDATLWTATRHSFTLPAEHRVPEIKPSLQWEFARAVDKLAALLGDGPYLMGETFTVPDIIAAHCATWARYAKFPLENEAFNAYTKRLRARPAHQKVMSQG